MTTTQKQSFTLSNVIQHKNTLTDEQKEAFIDIFGQGCQAKRKGNLRKAIHDVETSDNFDNWSIYKQVIFTENEPYCAYFAGQDYSQGVKTIREAFTKGY